MANVTGLQSTTVKSELIVINYDDGTSNSIKVTVGDLVKVSYVVNGTLKSDVIGRLASVDIQAVRDLNGTASKEFVFDCSSAYTSSIERVDVKNIRTIELYTAP